MFMRGSKYVKVYGFVEVLSGTTDERCDGRLTVGLD